MDGLKKLYTMITYAKSFDSTCFESNVPIFMHRNTIFTTFIQKHESATTKNPTHHKSI